MVIPLMWSGEINVCVGCMCGLVFYKLTKHVCAHQGYSFVLAASVRHPPRWLLCGMNDTGCSGQGLKY